MQIHELKHPKKTALEEGLVDSLKAMFSDDPDLQGLTLKQRTQAVAQERKLKDLAEKSRATWEQYRLQLARSLGGSPYSRIAPTAPAQPGAQTPAQTPATPAQATTTPASQDPKILDALEQLDVKDLQLIQRALETRGRQKMSEGVLDTVKAGVKLAPQFAQQVAQGYKSAAEKGVAAVKAAPGAVARTAGGAAGAVAGMPLAASRAFKAGKRRVAGAPMTMDQLNRLIYQMDPKEAAKLAQYAKQLLQQRQTPATPPAGTLKEAAGVPYDPKLLPQFQQALLAFVQKNMLGGMPYSRLANVVQIEDIVKDIADPAKQDNRTLDLLWNKLLQAVSVAYTLPQASGGLAPQGAPAVTGTAATTAPATAAKAKPKAPTDDAMKAELLQAAEALKMGKGQLQKIGQLIANEYANKNRTISSTGEPGVDTFLELMGFNVQ